MPSEYISHFAIQAIKVAASLAGPLLLAALVTGLIISLLQAATQINEMTLSFIPKILAVVLVLIILILIFLLGFDQVFCLLPVF